MPLDIVTMLTAWRDEVKAVAKRRAKRKRNKVILLDDLVAADE